MPLPPRAHSLNYFLLGSPVIICIFHLAGVDVAVFGGGGAIPTLRLRSTRVSTPRPYMKTLQLLSNRPEMRLCRS